MTPPLMLTERDLALARGSLLERAGRLRARAASQRQPAAGRNLDRARECEELAVNLTFLRPGDRIEVAS